MSDLDLTIHTIDTCDFTEDYEFDLITECSQLLANIDKDSQEQVRKIMIHVLNRWNCLSDTYKPIWSDIAESVGFYPYLAQNANVIQMDSLADKVRQQFHKSHYIEGVYMHSEQKKVSDIIFSGKNLVVSAPTSFGKSLLIEEIVASKKYKNIVVIQPTLALLDETRRKLKKYNNDYKIIVRTTQQFSEEKSNLFLLTAERVIEYESFPRIDFLIIDEFYKLSLQREDDDSDRVNALNNAFLRLYNSFRPQFYLLGPNIQSISNKFKQQYDAEFYPTNYSLVDSLVTDMSHSYDENLGKQKRDKAKQESLFNLLYDKLFNDQTLVFCSSPNRCRKLAENYFQFLKSRNINQNDLPLCGWINDNYKRWSLNKYLKYGIGIHDASLPKHIGNAIVKYFNQKRLKVIFCTSTIIEGVNTSASNVIVFDDNKGGNELDYFDFCNIRGRAGRMMEHYIGYIYNYIPIPPKMNLSVDVPFCDQETISSEILVNIKKTDVVEKRKEEYKELYKTPSDLLQIFKKNGISIAKQKDVVRQLELSIQNSSWKNLIWKNIPTWDNLLFLFQIADKCKLFPSNDCVKSPIQLCKVLKSYRMTKSLSTLIEDRYKYYNKSNTFDQQKYDEAVEWAFRLHRRWFQYVIPKVIRVIDSLQRYVLEKSNKETGSYSYYVQELESDFLPSNFTILIEYGIPSSTIRKLERFVPKNLSEDDVVAFIRNNATRIKGSLSLYEQELLDNI